MEHAPADRAEEPVAEEQGDVPITARKIANDDDADRDPDQRGDLPISPPIDVGFRLGQVDVRDDQRKRGVARSSAIDGSAGPGGGTDRGGRSVRPGCGSGSGIGRSRAGPGRSRDDSSARLAGRPRPRAVERLAGPLRCTRCRTSSLRPPHSDGAELLSIGSELTVGETRDTNAGELARALTQAGRHASAGSRRSRIASSRDRGVRRGASRAPISSSRTGGLGPTPDDLTREAIAAALGETVTVDPELEAWLRAPLGAARHAVPREQPQAGLADPVVASRSPTRTARRRAGSSRRPDGRRRVALPGPPREMRPMWSDEVMPRLRARGLGHGSRRPDVPPDGHRRVDRSPRSSARMLLATARPGGRHIRPARGGRRPGQRLGGRTRPVRAPRPASTRPRPSSASASATTSGPRETRPGPMRSGAGSPHSAGAGGRRDRDAAGRSRRCSAMSPWLPLVEARAQRGGGLRATVTRAGDEASTAATGSRQARPGPGPRPTSAWRSAPGPRGSERPSASRSSTPERRAPADAHDVPRRAPWAGARRR